MRRYSEVGGRDKGMGRENGDIGGGKYALVEGRVLWQCMNDTQQWTAQQL